MAKAPKKPAAEKSVETLVYPDSKRRNIPTAELEALAAASPVQVAYERRNRDLDPQLVWRGKDEQDLSDLTVNAPPLYIQEKVHPKALIDDLLRQTREQKHNQGDIPIDLFSDFNGIPKDADKTEFYQHDQNWTNRMILGDSLQVMASLAEREGLRGKVQCIYFDPPYGIKFNSNFQWSTTSRDVKDGNASHITREPEQVKAFRDTWRDGIHSYLTYLRDRLVVARDLLTESGSIFVQIGDENVHRVRAVLDEVFGEANFCSLITFQKTAAVSSPEARTNVIGSLGDYILWYAKSITEVKYRQPYLRKGVSEGAGSAYRSIVDVRGNKRTLSEDELENPSLIPEGDRVFQATALQSPGYSEALSKPIQFEGASFAPNSNAHWKTTLKGLDRLRVSNRLHRSGNTLRYVRFIDDFAVSSLGNFWTDLMGSQQMTYVVQTNTRVVERCMLMASDPSDLVLDPTCGSGTTATVAEQWGRRWITIDTSRVALALARARIMGARYPSYLLADSREGQRKEAEFTRTIPSEAPTYGNVRQGFVYERVPHVTLKSIANNAEIDVIWETWQQTLEPLRTELNAGLKQKWEEWEIPREADAKWSAKSKEAHGKWWEARIARQREIDASIAAKADTEYLYDKPYEDKKKVRVAGPFTVESLSPHRTLGVDENDELIDTVMEAKNGYKVRDFPTMILDNLKTAGVQQASKADRIDFTSLTAWPGDYVCADGRYLESGAEKRAAIFIGPEFGTVARQDLVAAAREAAEGGFDVLVACAFNFEAHTTEFTKLGKVPVLKARMNADLHMSDLKQTDKANLFVVFGEPDITVIPADGGRVRVKVNGVDVFDPSTGQVRSDDADGIACWFIDTDYNMESFFVRHAYFLGASDPYKSLKTTLKAEINQEAWESLNSDTSRAFEKPKGGKIAVKVINHLGDEVMKVFRV
ncbi:MAG: site-specific DNA-methyltransferase [Gemmatimonas sp.]